MRFPFALKIGMAISILSVGVTSTSVYFYYAKTKQIVLNQMAERLRDVGRSAAFLVDDEDKKKIQRLSLAIERDSLPIEEIITQLKPGDTAESLPPEIAQKYMQSQDFQDLMQVLKNIQKSSSQKVYPLTFFKELTEDTSDIPLIKSTSLIVKVGESQNGDVVKFIADTDREESQDKKGKIIGQLYATKQEELQKAFDGKPQAGKKFYTDRWGQFLTAAIPIKDDDGKVIAVMGLEYDGRIEANQVQRLRYIYITIISISFLLSLLIAFLLARWLGHPIDKLRAGAEKVRDRNFDIFIDIQSKDELGLLADAFNSMVSEIHDYAQNLELKNKTLLQINQLKDEFLINTSHELQTPLDGIIGIAESMLDGAAGQLSEIQKQNLYMIVQSSQRLANMVNDIVDLEKLKHKTLELKIKPVGMREVTDIVLALSKPLTANKSLQLINQIDSAVPLVEADENRVQQILYNLVCNAIKFTESGVIEVSASIRAGDRGLVIGSILPQSPVPSSQSLMLAITVSDTGIGIPENKLEKIFDAFEFAEESTNKRYLGTGIRLAVTKQLVELHSGTIRVDSTVGKGSRFTFTLPLSQVQSTQNLDPKPKEQLSIGNKNESLNGGETLFKANYQQEANSVYKLRTTAKGIPIGLLALRQVASEWENFSNLPFPYCPLPAKSETSVASSPKKKVFSGNFTILIVEDDPVNLQILTNYLSLENYTVFQAGDGIEALEAIENGLKPDLILLDVMMPKMSGFEVCKKLRKTFPANELPIFIVTAANNVSNVIEIFECGANDYLVKPVAKNELLARIKTHIELSKINIAYRRFVPHEFISLLGEESIVNVQLGDQVQKEMTILFSDIRAFTTLSEGMSPKENFNFINSYLSRVSPVIRQNNGFIDKYIGDAVMALFPQSAEDALQAAIEMQKQVSLYNVELIKNGSPPIAIGIGIHSGTLMLGTIGDEQRMEGTVISDAVNLASRLEDLTKVYGASIIISEKTLLGLEDPTKYNYRFLDRVNIKGRKDLSPVFEVFDSNSAEIREVKSGTRSHFEFGIHLYYSKKFAEAEQVFSNVLEQNNQDKAARLYVKRCQRLQKRGTDEGWHGVEPFDEEF